MTRRIPWKWIGIAAVVLILGLSMMRVLSGRKAQQESAAQASEAKAQAVIELAPTDILKAQNADIAQGLPVSGTLKAVNSASVKARVAGELRDLAVREGDIVKQGEVLARVDETEYTARVKQAQQQADAAQSQIDIAQRQYDNNKALVDQGFISKSALDTSWNSLVGAQATHRAAVAAVDVAKKSLDDTVLKAPITGVVSVRAVQPGERVAIDAKIVDIVDLSRLEMEATLSAADSVDVRVGQEATLQIEGTARPVQARVVRINPTAQAGSRSVLAYLAVTDAVGLRQGLFAQGTIGTGHMQAIAVPVAAVRTDKPAPYVQIVEDNKVAHKTVQTGTRGEVDGEPVVAVKGVPLGAVVIRGSAGPLREGTVVRFTAPPKP